jgi:hypothetical protein
MIRNLVIFLTILGLFAAFITNCRGLENEKKNKEQAEMIIKSLYEYREVHNSFPNELRDLVPEFLKQIPKTTGGQEYFYLINSTDRFLISFMMSSHYGCGYSDKLKEWECSSGD